MGKSYDDHAELLEKGEIDRETVTKRTINLQFKRKHSGHSTFSGNGIDLDRAELILFGKDLSELSKFKQFIICGSGVFFFTIIFGFLQELITVQVAGRNLGVFLASVQFAGYAFWSLFLDSMRPDQRAQLNQVGLSEFLKKSFRHELPLRLCISLSTLKALELGLTYEALHYVDYSTKVLFSSARLVFTMVLGVFVSGKNYTRNEYINAICIVLGLAIFLHADAKSSAIFHPIGVLLLSAAHICDGLLSNSSEFAMNEYEVGHDAFQLHLSSIASVALLFVAFIRGELLDGIRFFCTAGTYEEIEYGDFPSWTVQQKLLVMILFSSFGIFGESCAGAITKTHGAFYMALTTTSRKAASLMVSFLLLPNTCTFQHSCGIGLFLFALLMNSRQIK